MPERYRPTFAEVVGIDKPAMTPDPEGGWVPFTALADLRERLAREFERRAATAVDGVAAGFQTNAAQLVRTFGTTEEER